MQKITRRPVNRNTDPDLFSWRPVVLVITPVAVRKLASRFGLSIAHAATVARLAGIGSEVER